MQELLPELRSIAGDVFVFQQDSACTNTLRSWHGRDTQFINLDIISDSGQPTVLTLIQLPDATACTASTCINSGCGRVASVIVETWVECHHDMVHKSVTKGISQGSAVTFSMCGKNAKKFVSNLFKIPCWQKLLKSVYFWLGYSKNNRLVFFNHGVDIRKRDTNSQKMKRTKMLPEVTAMFPIIISVFMNVNKEACTRRRATTHRGHQ